MFFDVRDLSASICKLDPMALDFYGILSCGHGMFIMVSIVLSVLGK